MAWRIVFTMARQIERKDGVPRESASMFRRQQNDPPSNPCSSRSGRPAPRRE